MAKPSSVWWLPLVLAAMSLIMSAFVGYNRNDKDLASRVSVLEAHQDDSVDRLGRIETKINRIDDKIDELIEKLSQLRQVSPVASSPVRPPFGSGGR